MRTLPNGSQTYAYDNCGNLTSRTGFDADLSLTWNPRGRLTAVTSTETGASVSYQYDYRDDQIARTDNGQTTWYLIDDQNPTGYAQVIAELDDLDRPVRRYFYGDRLLADEHVGPDAAPEGRLHYVSDHLHSTRLLVDDSGTPVERYDYAAYGVTDRSRRATWADPTWTTTWGIPCTSATPYLYTGEFIDCTTGLQYNRARWYSAVGGKFVSPDPVLDALNGYAPYAYAGRIPTAVADPQGTVASVIVVGAVVGGIAGAFAGFSAFRARGWSGTAGAMLGAGIGAPLGAFAFAAGAGQLALQLGLLGTFAMRGALCTFLLLPLMRLILDLARIWESLPAITMAPRGSAKPDPALFSVVTRRVVDNSTPGRVDAKADCELWYDGREVPHDFRWSIREEFDGGWPPMAKTETRVGKEMIGPGFTDAYAINLGSESARQYISIKIDGWWWRVAAYDVEKSATERNGHFFARTEVEGFTPTISPLESWWRWFWWY